MHDVKARGRHSFFDTTPECYPNKADKFTALSGRITDLKSKL